MSKREEILERIPAIPPLPASATQMLTLVGNTDTQLTDVQRVVEYDPGLVSNLLRLANSAYFGTGGPINSVREAVVRLGIKRVFQIAMTSAVAPLAQQEIRGYDLPRNGLLRHSAATALAVEYLPKRMSMRVPDATYTAGLLHDLGKIVMGSFLEVDSAPITLMAYREKLSFELAEHRVLGTDHAEVGAALLGFWKLPQAVVDAVRWHHAPNAYPHADKTVVDLVHLGEHVARICGTSSSTDGMNYSVCIESLERLRMTPEILEQVAGDVLGSLEEICAIFN
ncbi:MAG: HDOD domain-containing protein [Candidatus Hydrogenedentes bacterium]|nr:HDOD domain-containing protein [Candidatus Hydrogenedentota bacterium]